jgi:hypothetical protein
MTIRVGWWRRGGVAALALAVLVGLNGPQALAKDGTTVVWRTTEPLPQLAAGGLRAWQLAGPCVRDVDGQMWAFLLDFPGQLSRHDGQRWIHRDLALGARIPQEMTSDDKGRLQIGFQDYPAGSCLVSNGDDVVWFATPTLAWIESVKTGVASLNNGSPYRYWHVLGGKADWLWTYNGRSLWEAGREYEYYESPQYRQYWIGTNGSCYRSGAGPVWGFANGRWTETQMPPLSIGPDGIRACTGPGRLPVIYDGQTKLPLPGSSAGGKPRVLTLQGNEAFLPAADGGGWVGPNRVFRGACYPVAGRIYPGTNGHYLVIDKTLRFQAQQKLTVTGELLCDGNLRRLVCRIAGTAPLFQPRLLAFLDGEFCDALADPTGGDLAPISSGLHTLEVYAADGFGVLSAEPLRLAVEGPPEYPAKDLKLDEAWALKPQRLQVVPTTIAGRSVLGWKLEIDADGVVWILVNGGVISLDLANRKAASYPIPAHEIIAARGRVWALGSAQRPGMKWPLYELDREGIRHAVDLYDDTSDRGFSQVSADGQGGIWTLSKMGLTRWDGKQTQFWERPVGFEQSSTLVSYPDGAIIHAWDRYFLYRNGELSQGIPWDKSVLRDEGYMDYANLYPLGRAHLVCAERQALVDVDTGRISKRKIPAGETYRWGGNGDLYVWQSDALLRVSGMDFTVTHLPCVPPPSLSSCRYTSDRYAFLATTNGILAYPSGRGSLILGPENGGAVEYGWREMVEPGDTMSIRRSSPPMDASTSADVSGMDRPGRPCRKGVFHATCAENCSNSAATMASSPSTGLTAARLQPLKRRRNA